MANWYGSARSNYFRVKDRDAFLAWAEELGLTVMHTKDGSDLFGIHRATPKTVIGLHRCL